jgi:pilus assembly protein Flp/PilA
VNRLLMVSAFAIEENDMNSFARRIRRFLASEDGPTAVEYAVLLALIIAVCIASVKRMGEMVDQRFIEVERAF